MHAGCPKLLVGHAFKRVWSVLSQIPVQAIAKRGTTSWVCGRGVLSWGVFGLGLAFGLGDRTGWVRLACLVKLAFG